MFEDYLTQLAISSKFKPFQFGTSIDKYVSEFPNLENKKIAIIGVPEGRKSGKNSSTNLAANEVRDELYKLVSNTFIQNHIVDLGNIKTGKTFEDTQVALKTVVAQLHTQNIVSIVIGGSTELSSALYESFEVQEKNTDITFISSSLPILDGELLDKICKHEPNFLHNLNALGFQGHYLPPRTLDVMENLGFGHVRLGALRNKIEEAEVLIRNTNLILFDIGVIKHSDAPANFYSNPIGIDSNMACQLAWYSGVSDTSNCFGIFETNPEFDERGLTSKLVAQILWYFIDGFAHRKHDHPKLHDEFLRYRCNLHNKQPDLLFHKSKRTNRWWMEIPHPRSQHNASKNVTIPCSYSDYQMAATGDLPDRYLNALQKLH